jgi:hypothetical protein
VWIRNGTSTEIRQCPNRLRKRSIFAAQPLKGAADPKTYGIAKAMSWYETRVSDALTSRQPPATYPHSQYKEARKVA